MAQHRSFLVLPDPKLSGESAVHSASSQAGRIPGRGTPLSTNEGNLSAFVTGKAETDNSSFRLRIQTSGGVTDGGTWAWKRSGEADTNLRGSNDRRFLHALTDPYHPGGASSPIPVARTEILYSPRLNREYVYKDRNGVRLDVLYRTVGETEGAWTSSTARFEGGIDFNGSEAMQFAGCVLPDGAFRMVVQRANDLDVYHSEDGLTWERVADNIVSRFALRLFTTSLNGLWLVESGGYLMITAAEPDVDGIAGLGTYLTTFVSSDRGSTWTEIDFGTFPLGLALAKYGPSGIDRYAISVCGVGDAAGTFFYTNRSNAQPNAFIVARRSGFGSWGNVEIYTLTGSTEFDRVILGRTATHIVALFVDIAGIYSRVSSPGEYGISTLDRRISLNDQEWSTPTTFTKFDGSPRYRIGLGKAIWIGHSLAIFGKKYEWQTGARVNGTVYQRLGEAWSKAPISDLVWDGYASGTRPIGHQPTTKLFNAIEWHAHYGLPVDSTFTPWQTAGTGAVGRRGDRIVLVATPTRSIRYDYEDPTSIGSAPNVSWMTTTNRTVIGGSLVAWEVSVDVAASSDASVEVASRDVSNPGDSVHVKVSFDQTQAFIRDQNTGGLLATLTPDVGIYGATPFADRWEFRLCFMPRPGTAARHCLLMCRKFGTTDWISTDIVNFSKVPVSIGPSTVTQFVRWGIPTIPPSSIQTTWFSFRIHQGDDLRQAVQVRPGNPALDDETKAHATRGRECSPFPVSIVEGVEASWGGGGGFDGDLFDTLVQYQYAASNMLLGPRFQYRSEDGVGSGPNIIFTAGSESHARFRHDAIGIFGLNSGEVSVEYDDDPSFPSPTAAGTISLRRFQNLRVGAVDGESVTIQAATLPRDGEVASNDARRFFAHVNAIPAGCTSIAVGDVFEITKQRESVLDLDTGLFLTATVGTTLSVYSDRGVLTYSSPIVGRFMRLTLATVNPPATRYEIGAVVAGSTMVFDVPLEWEHSDEDTPTATTYRSRSGISWAYVEGPPRRTVTGTVIGDAGTFRARLRNLLRATARYVENPVVLCMDERDLTDAETTVLARIPNGISFEQTGWRYLDDEDRWIAVGDASLDFEQDV